MGLVLGSAAFAVVMPTEWMAAVNRAVGLGEMPGGPLVEYLTRTCSAMYAVHGAVLVFCSFDVRRYLPLIRFLACLSLVFGPVMLAIDLWAGMPPSWTWSEGPSIVVMNCAVLWLANRVDRQGIAPNE